MPSSTSPLYPFKKKGKKGKKGAAEAGPVVPYNPVTLPAKYEFGDCMSKAINSKNSSILKAQVMLEALLERQNAAQHPSMLQAGETKGGDAGEGKEGKGGDAADGGMKLDLCAMELDELPKAICYFTDIETLLLSRNRLFNSSRLFEAIEANRAMTRLDLGSNHLNGPLSSSVGALTCLRELILDHNHLTELPLELAQCTKIEVFSARLNQITVLDAHARTWTSLRRLDVRSNLITALPAALGEMTNLEVLYASSNKITDIPEGIGNLVKVRSAGVVWGL